jgi:cystathionine beta-lyase/cystathionine gamma-synthase
MAQPPRVATLAAHAGRLPFDRPRDQPSTALPHIDAIAQATVWDFATIAASEVPLAGDGGPVYARYGGPNPDALGEGVAALERAEAGLATAYGMSAVGAATLALASAGDRLVVQRDAYGGTPALMTADFARLGFEVAFVDAYDLEAVDAALEGAAMLLVESISNPLLRRVDLALLAAACRSRGARLVVDNTFATPLGCRPLEHGADLVIHSVTKFLSGHHDVCAGAVVGGAALVANAAGVARRLGLTARPFDAWLAVRGLRTLEVRMRRAWTTAAELARRLAVHDRVREVYATEKCALVSFDLGSWDAAARAIERARLITLTPSLGGVTTTFSHSASSSHRSLTAEQRVAAGISDGLLRLSVGLEDVEDLWQDLASAL